MDLILSGSVDIGTEWNLKGHSYCSQRNSGSVDIGTEWNLKLLCPCRSSSGFSVDIGTEWNLKVFLTVWLFLRNSLI